MKFWRVSFTYDVDGEEIFYDTDYEVRYIRVSVNDGERGIVASTARNLPLPSTLACIYTDFSHFLHQMDKNLTSYRMSPVKWLLVLSRHDWSKLKYKSNSLRAVIFLVLLTYGRPSTANTTQRVLCSRSLASGHFPRVDNNKELIQIITS